MPAVTLKTLAGFPYAPYGGGQTVACITGDEITVDGDIAQGLVDQGLAEDPEGRFKKRSAEELKALRAGGPAAFPIDRRSREEALAEQTPTATVALTGAGIERYADGTGESMVAHDLQRLPEEKARLAAVAASRPAGPQGDVAQAAEGLPGAPLTASAAAGQEIDLEAEAKVREEQEGQRAKAARGGREAKERRPAETKDAGGAPENKAADMSKAAARPAPTPGARAVQP